MLEHGGPLLRNEHMAACKEIIEKTSNNFAEKLEEKFDFQREWVTQELRAMLADIRLLIISSEKKTSSSK